MSEDLTVSNEELTGNRQQRELEEFEEREWKETIGPINENRAHEILFMLYGDVEAELQFARKEYESLREIDPAREATQAALQEVQKLESIMNMPVKERISLEQEFELLELEYGEDFMNRPLNATIAMKNETRARQLQSMLHGDVESELQVAREEYESLQKIDPERDTTQTALWKVQRLEYIANMPTEERERLQRELEDVEVKLGIREIQQPHERQEEQKQPVERNKESQKPLVEKVNGCVKLLKARLSDMVEKATAPALKLYYSRRKEGLEAMKKELGQEKTRGHAQGLAR